MGIDGQREVRAEGTTDSRKIQVVEYVNPSSLTRFLTWIFAAANLVFALGRWYTFDSYHPFWYWMLINTGVYFLIIVIPLILLPVYFLVGDRMGYKIATAAVVIATLALEFMVLDH